MAGTEIKFLVAAAAAAVAAVAASAAARTAAAVAAVAASAAARTAAAAAAVAAAGTTGSRRVVGGDESKYRGLELGYWGVLPTFLKISSVVRAVSVDLSGPERSKARSSVTV